MVSVVLSPELLARVQERVNSGRFDDPEAVIREALSLLERQARFTTLRDAIASGCAQAERGEVAELTDELLARINESAMRRFRAGEEPNPLVMPLDDAT